MPSGGPFLFPAIWLGLGAEASRWEPPGGEPLVGASAGLGIDVAEGLWLEARVGWSSERENRFPHLRATNINTVDGQMYEADPGKWADARMNVRLMSGSVSRPRLAPLDLALAGFIGAGALEQREWVLFDNDEPGPTSSLAATTEAGVTMRARWPGAVAFEFYLEAYDRAWLWSSPERLSVAVQHDLVVGAGARMVFRRPPPP